MVTGIIEVASSHINRGGSGICAKCFFEKEKRNEVPLYQPEAGGDGIVPPKWSCVVCSGSFDEGAGE